MAHRNNTDDHPPLKAEDLTPYFTQDTPVYVAYSGGIDSCVLLHLCVQLRNQGVIGSLHALHIHHGLQTDADQWSDHCLAIGQKWQVHTHIEHVQVASTGSQEQAARKARYRVFSRYLHQPALLLQAHHRNDQAETVLFRLLRGTGIRGLSGIPHKRKLAQGYILRPLIDYSKAQIHHYAQQHQLTWVEDHSNQDSQFDRNFLRLQVLPSLAKRWPQLNKHLAAAATQAQEAHDLLQEMAATLYQSAVRSGSGLLQGFIGLSVPQLVALSKPQQRLLLRYWLEQQNVSVPDCAPLNALLDSMTTPRNDAQPRCDLPCKARVYRWQQTLYVLPNTFIHHEPKPIKWPSHSNSLAGDHGLLTLQKRVHPLALNRWPQALSIGYRDQHPAAVTLRVAHRMGSKTLKRWLQAYQVPPWLRSRIPLLYADGQLIAAIGLWVAEGWQVPTGQCGYYLQWEPPWSAALQG